MTVASSDVCKFDLLLCNRFSKNSSSAPQVGCEARPGVEGTPEGDVSGLVTGVRV